MKHFWMLVLLGILFIIITVISPILIETFNNLGIISDEWRNFFASYLGGIYGGVATLMAVLITVHSTNEIQKKEILRANEIKRLEVQPIIEVKKGVSIGSGNSKINLDASFLFTFINYGFNIAKNMKVEYETDFKLDFLEYNIDIVELKKERHFRFRFFLEDNSIIFGEQHMIIKLRYFDIYNNEYKSKYNFKFRIEKDDNGFWGCRYIDLEEIPKI